MRSLAVSSWGTEEGGDLGEAKAEEPARCNANRAQETQPRGLLVSVLVTFRDYLALLNNVTIDIYVGAHLLSFWGTGSEISWGEFTASGLTPSL